MSHTDKAFIKAFRPGRPARESARVETTRVESARSEPAAAPATVGGASPAPLPERIVSATLPAIEREPSEAPDTPLLTAGEIALLRGALGALPDVAQETPAVAASVPEPSAMSVEVLAVRTIEAAPVAVSAPSEQPAARVSVTKAKLHEAASAPIAAAQPLSAPAVAVSQPATNAEPVASPTPTHAPKTTEPASAPKQSASVPVGSAGLRGLRLRTLADFTEDRGGEDAGWTVRNRVRKFEVSGVCGSLLKQRQAEFAALTEILKARMRDGLKTLWVASCRGNEGASTFVVCLAAAVAATGAKVVAVDHDLTNPGLSDLLHLQPEKGWREVLLGEIPLTDGLWQSDEGWAALPLRTDHAAPLSGSHLPRLRLNMAMLRREYDLVLLDAGPLRLAGDDELAYPQPDAALLVRDPQSTSAEDLSRHVERLAARRLELLGVVENFVHDAEPALT